MNISFLKKLTDDKKKNLHLHLILAAVQILTAQEPALLGLGRIRNCLANDEWENNRDQDSVHKVRTQSIEIPQQNLKVCWFILEPSIDFSSPLYLDGDAMNIRRRHLRLINHSFMRCLNLRTDLCSHSSFCCR